MLKRRWNQAQATVIAAQQRDDKPVYTKHGGGTLRRRYEYVLDVQPPSDEAMFRATVISPLNVDTMRVLNVGEVVPVLCHGEKVEFDTSDPSIQREAAEKTAQAEFDAIRNAAPGTKAEEPDPYGLLAALAEKKARQSATAPAEREVVVRSGDRLEGLEKLADLHDRGVLSDDEFAAEKSKILNEKNPS